MNPSTSDRRRNVSRRDAVLGESSTGEPLAGFTRYTSIIVPSLNRQVRRKTYLAGIPRRADAPAANDSVLLVTYAVEKSGDARTTTALATGAYRTLP